ncbi:hypothetical protein SAMN05444166_4749 [Singulisphaera sp. GP187]|uniref:hypothetical protein n=1 Tax=Singulisphaera sp. GP187 TaxID=1882752 RepID=UPI00092AFEFF|nr:hypothetical protein [Singulisphaera sp. GP187]SIO44116.1 hypothetical protein SAMN05444166_4749 [Singulisphaera sp. GP187]
MDRREMLGMVGAGAIGLTAMSAGADETASGENCCQLDEAHADCYKACADCAKACDITFHHCFKELAAGKKEHAKALHLASDCAAFCSLSASMIAKHSPLMASSCHACADACKATAAEVGKFDSAEMKAATKSLHDCEKSCRAMVAKMAGKTELRAN